MPKLEYSLLSLIALYFITAVSAVLCAQGSHPLALLIGYILFAGTIIGLLGTLTLAADDYRVDDDISLGAWAAIFFALLLAMLAIRYVVIGLTIEPLIREVSALTEIRSNLEKKPPIPSLANIHNAEFNIRRSLRSTQLLPREIDAELALLKATALLLDGRAAEAHERLEHALTANPNLHFGKLPDQTRINYLLHKARLSGGITDELFQRIASTIMENTRADVVTESRFPVLTPEKPTTRKSVRGLAIITGHLFQADPPKTIKSRGSRDWLEIMTGTTRTTQSSFAWSSDCQLWHCFVIDNALDSPVLVVFGSNLEHIAKVEAKTYRKLDTRSVLKAEAGRIYFFSFSVDSGDNRINVLDHFSISTRKTRLLTQNIADIASTTAASTAAITRYLRTGLSADFSDQSGPEIGLVYSPGMTQVYRLQSFEYQ